MLRKAALVASIIAPIAAATGCGRDSVGAPSCGTVAAKFLMLATESLDQARTSAKLDDAGRRAVLAQLPAMRDSLTTACTDTQWSEQVRRCLHAAADHVGFETCQRALTENQRRALDRAARGQDAMDRD